MVLYWKSALRYFLSDFGCFISYHFSTTGSLLLASAVVFRLWLSVIVSPLPNFGGRFSDMGDQFSFFHNPFHLSVSCCQLSVVVFRFLFLMVALLFSVFAVLLSVLCSLLQVMFFRCRFYVF